jgi:tetratricopeptide (TPR) repeat protein
MIQAPDIRDLTPEQVSQHLASCAPQPARQPLAMLLLVVLIASVLLLLASDQALLLLLSWLILGGMVWWMSYHRARIVNLREQVRQAGEMAMLRRWPEAVQRCWRLLPLLRRMPQQHGQAVSVLCGSLMNLRAWEPAVAAQEHLLRLMQDEHPLALVLRANRVMALLHAERLLDADDELRRLKQVATQPLPRAAAMLAELHQLLTTNHDHEAIGRADEMIEILQPLGHEAALGYAMIALACHRQGQTDEAKTWWARALLLMDRQVIVQQLPEVEALSTSHVAAPPWEEKQIEAAWGFPQPQPPTTPVDQASGDPGGST